MCEVRAVFLAVDFWVYSPVVFKHFENLKNFIILNILETEIGYHILSHTGNLFKNLRGRLIEWGIHLQIQTIADIAFFFGTRQAIEKTTYLHYYLFISFILYNIHFLIGILSIRGRSEWIYVITFVN